MRWRPAALLSVFAVQLLVCRAAPGTADPLLLVKCMNEKRRNAAASWSSCMADEPASLTVAGAWWSGKKVNADTAGPLTIVTQMSANRLTQLWSQCQSWPGPISAAIHLSLVQPRPGPLTERNARLLKRIIKAMSNFHLLVESDHAACSLDAVLVFEIYTEKRATMLYPVNQMRNLARLQARTELIGLMDVDMLVSSSLSRSLQNPSHAALMIKTCSSKNVYVPPAFETYGGNAAMEADELAHRSKESLMRRVRRGNAGPFDSKRFVEGHNNTDFERWYRTSKQYEVVYRGRYEPWMIASRTEIPWHDVRFRGYGSNKIVHVAHTNALGFRFIVHPTAFIIHRAHRLTAARTQLIADMDQDFKMNQMEKTKTRVRLVGDDTIYGHSSKLWEDAKQQMDAGSYQPVLDEATLHCRQTLPWWADAGTPGASEGSFAGPSPTHLVLHD